MNEETIIENATSKDELEKRESCKPQFESTASANHSEAEPDPCKCQSDESTEQACEDTTAGNVPKSESKGKRKAGGIAGLAGAAGLAGGMLIPKMVFPQEATNDENLVIESDEDLESVETPSNVSGSGHIVGHDMDVAYGVNDSMSFGEAFAAARSEVGAGGLFVWHGNTYGTYYANEWNTMSADDKEQYWADVFHTTSGFNDELSRHDVGQENDTPHDVDPKEPDSVEPDPIEPDPIEPDPIEPDPIEPDSIEPDPEESFIPNIDPETGTLHISEEQFHGAFDTDWDGITDGLEVDVNGNDIPDLVIDHDGDGTFDTLEIDADIDGGVAEIHTISDVVIDKDEIELDTDDIAGDLNEDISDALDVDPLTDAPGDELAGYDALPDMDSTDNPDVDILADVTPDLDIPSDSLDNDMNMEEFV